MDDRSSERLLEVIFEHSHALMAYLDPQFNFVRVSSAYASLDERAAEDFVGKNHFELFPNTENLSIFQGAVDTRHGPRSQRPDASVKIRPVGVWGQAVQLLHLHTIARGIPDTRDNCHDIANGGQADASRPWPGWGIDKTAARVMLDYM